MRAMGAEASRGATCRFSLARAAAACSERSSEMIERRTEISGD